ncbi:Endoplasmic reticulum protein EP58, contains filamin rod domain and KDEL motif [Phaffia rhodozyma]|uniref:Endoplasmic reticulum protein EP58, contains filamin rod domain and KDEL motif n=1 Tax=Phaffia rhodozyma TaxID=264483 RepID=A0A0F7SUD5_PHARH|nr:Endoplasmic reticulum protein EP58, contains filamin rod domain and KDEL motif [Phaffia rhodozyma]
MFLSTNPYRTVSEAESPLSNRPAILSSHQYPKAKRAQGRRHKSSIDDNLDDPYGKANRSENVPTNLSSYVTSRRKIIPRRRVFLLFVLSVIFFVFWPVMHRSTPDIVASVDRLRQPLFHSSVRLSILDSSFGSSRKEDKVAFTPVKDDIVSTHSITHSVSPDGLLHLDPSLPVSQHPIYQLMDSARKEWNDKLAQQSTTLAEAVAEYKRRYYIDPPKGFEQWWKWCREHNVQLLDEYDQIHRDLAPFRALRPSVIQERLARIQSLPDMFTISVRNGQVNSSHVTYDARAIAGSDDRRLGQIELIERVAQFIPDFTAVYSIHDSPTRFISHSHKQDLLDHADDNEFFDIRNEVVSSQAGWMAACPENTSLGKYGINSKVTTVAAVDADKTFISSHSASMDLCNHPDVLSLHGTFVSLRPGTQSELMPYFSLSKTNLHSDILGVPTERWSDIGPNDKVKRWEEKTDKRLFWRGKNTGGIFNKQIDWRKNHRSRLVGLMGPVGKKNRGVKSSMIDMLSSPRTLAFAEADDDKMILGRMIEKKRQADLNKLMMDVAFVSEPVQCDEKDGTCADIKDELAFKDFLNVEEQSSYKYQLDVDGNAWSARFKRLMTSGSLVLKSTVHPEFWTDRIQPWLHYVPVKVDYSDVYEILNFFRGDDSEGLSGEDDLAALIAESGREWSLSFWRKEDMTAYVFRLYLEWARIQAPDRFRADFLLKDAQEDPLRVVSPLDGFSRRSD